MFRVVLLVLALLVLGCASKPVLQLHSMHVSAVSPQGLGLVMRMRVNNHNPFDVKVRHVRASVLIARRFHLPPVYADPDVWLAANRSTIVDVPILVPWPMIQPLLMTTARSSVVEYRVKGYADVTAVRMLGIRRNDHRLDEEGMVSRAELVGAVSRSIPVQMPWMR